MTALRIVLGLVAWTFAAFPVAVVIGIALRRADDRQERAEAQQRHPSGRDLRDAS